MILYLHIVFIRDNKLFVNEQGHNNILEDILLNVTVDDFSYEKNAQVLLSSHNVTVCLYLAGNAGARSPRSVVPFTDKIIHDMRMNEVS